MTSKKDKDKNSNTDSDTDSDTNTDTNTDTNKTNIISYETPEDINKYLNNIPNKNNHPFIKIDTQAYHTEKDNNNVIYDDTIISENSTFVIRQDDTFIVKRSLINHGIIINNGRLIINMKHCLTSYFENHGELINYGLFEIHGVFSNLKKGSIVSNIIKNYGIFHNYGIIENNKIFQNEGIFNNNNKLIIKGETSNSYIFHNKKNTKTNQTNDDTILIPHIINNGTITNTHIIHNESLITNTNQNSFINSNILINTGTIINCKYSDKLVY